jgi:hypothetical protein
MDRQAFDLYVETQLAPFLQPGDVVILDNLAVHKSARTQAAVRACGARWLFLPQYSPRPEPDRNGILKAQSPPAADGRANHRRDVHPRRAATSTMQQGVRRSKRTPL